MKCRVCNKPYIWAVPFLPSGTPAVAGENKLDSEAEFGPSKGGKKKKNKESEDENNWLQLQESIPASIKTLAVKAMILDWFHGKTEEERPKIIIYVQWLDMYVATPLLV